MVELKGASGKPIPNYKQKRHPKLVKAQAVSIFLLTGNISETAHQTQVPIGTLTNWLREPWWMEMIEEQKLHG
ncbi:MAG: hypothetical protein ACREQ5_26660, partial [Candidatus Dormibacteria bacterium]